MREWGSPNSDDWRKSLAFCLTCGRGNANDIKSAFLLKKMGKVQIRRNLHFSMILSFEVDILHLFISYNTRGKTMLLLSIGRVKISLWNVVC